MENNLVPFLYIHGIIAVIPPSEAWGLTNRTAFHFYLPGYGANAGVALDKISIQGAVDLLHHRLKEKGIDRVHLLGHSVGGAVAMEFAAAHPEQVESVINAEGNFTLKDAFWTSQIAEMSHGDVEEMLTLFRSDTEGWFNRLGIAPTPERLAMAKASFEAQDARTLQAMSRSVVETTSDHRYLQRVREVFESHIPVHLVAGEKSREDWDVPSFALERASSITVQPSVGHLMQLEDLPGFAAIVRGLLD